MLDKTHAKEKKFYCQAYQIYDHMIFNLILINLILISFISLIALFSSTFFFIYINLSILKLKPTLKNFSSYLN